MNLKKQQLLLEYLISSVDIFSLCSSIIKHEYFEPELKNAVTFIQEYYNKYNTTPDSSQVNAETGVELSEQTITHDKIKYCADEIESFCKLRALENAIMKSATLISKNESGKIDELIKDAISVGLNDDLGINYFENPLDRLNRLDNEEAPQPTLWDGFDQALNGGIVRKQMTLFSANSGGGKSIVMKNLGCNLLKQGLTVLYVTLELSESMVSLRLDSILVGTPSADWRKFKKETATKIEKVKSSMGALFVKYMPAGTNCNSIRSYLKEFELTNGFIPDVLIVDYLDIMGSNDQSSNDNVFEKDKQAAEQLRNLGAEYDMHVITAAQQNRSAIDASDLNHSHIAGGLSKINTTDNYISIIMTDAMRASGEIAFQFLKTRSSDGVGKTIQLSWDSSTLRVTNKKESNFVNTFKQKKALDSPSGGSLMDLLDSTTS